MSKVSLHPYCLQTLFLDIRPQVALWYLLNIKLARPDLTTQTTSRKNARMQEKPYRSQTSAQLVHKVANRSNSEKSSWAEQIYGKLSRRGGEPVSAVSSLKDQGEKSQAETVNSPRDSCETRLCEASSSFKWFGIDLEEQGSLFRYRSDLAYQSWWLLSCCR